MVKKERENKKRSRLGSGTLGILLLLGVLLLINFLSYQLYARLDLTAENRFSLSENTEEMLGELDDVLYFKVYLEGDFPPVFKKLRGSVKDLLVEMKRAAGSNLEFEFIDPADSDDTKTTNEVFQQLLNSGLEPKDLQVRKKDGLDRQTIWPGAILTYHEEEIPINFVQSQSVGGDFNYQVNEAEEILEFEIANAIRKVTSKEKPRIAFSSGNGELDTAQLFDLYTSLEEYYRVDFYDLAKIEAIPAYFKAVIVAKPTEQFSEWNKFKIDNYLMTGGNIMFLLDGARAEMDSMGSNLFFMSFPNELNLDDQLFRYGLRLNYDLVQDQRCAKIAVNVSGQMELFPWYYFPLSSGISSHPIAKSVDPVWMRFASTIDPIFVEGIEHSVLLSSSRFSRVLPTPVRINLGLIRDVTKPEQFNKPNRTLALLLEGKFVSNYKNRNMNPFAKRAIDSIGMKMHSEAESDGKIIVISDGDVARNDVNPTNGNVLPLGYDRYSKNIFGNRNFLLNCIDFLVDDNGLIQLRSKEITLRLLDIQKVEEEKQFWQLFNLAFPILLMIIFGLVYHWLRIRHYAR